MNKQKKKVAVMEASEFQALLDALSGKEYQIHGPSVRDNAVVYKRISTVDDLPIGWLDDQDNGRYRLVKGKRKALFDYTVGPHTWKKFLFPPERKLWDITGDNRRFEIKKPDHPKQKQAFLGIRACELNAIIRLDTILTKGEFVDPFYLQSRQNLFIVAVNCTRPSGTCFCDSLNTGPRAETGFDLALTELIDSKRHCFVIETGSLAGKEILKAIPHKTADHSEIERAEKAVEKAALKMQRHLDADNIHDLLSQRFDSVYWEDVTSRCLTCGNCTMVCPTCFCSVVEDYTGLTGGQAQRCQKWDSCFSVDFSYIHGGSIRSTETSRYRQWMMHKLVYWLDQFGTLGCIGCGRCITWCPVGIDITEEAGKIAKND